MDDNNPLIFINYRTGDQELAALLLDRELSHRYGPDQVFLASRSLVVGRVFDTRLLAAVRGCGVLLSVIGRNWLTLTDARDRRLIDRRKDWVRLEIAEALAAGVPVIPVLVGDVSPLTAADLPPSIRRLAKHQFVRLRHRSFRPDFEYMITQLGALLDDSGGELGHVGLGVSGLSAVPPRDISALGHGHGTRESDEETRGT